MPKAQFVYVMTGDQTETFHSLPADPPARTLNPGDKVTCFAEVDHPRLQLLKQPGGQTSKTQQASS